MNGRSSSGERRAVSAHHVQRIPVADDFPVLEGSSSAGANGHSPNSAEPAAGKTAAQVLSMPAPPQPEPEHRQPKQEQEQAQEQSEDNVVRLLFLFPTLG